MTSCSQSFKVSMASVTLWESCRSTESKIAETGTIDSPKWVTASEGTGPLLLPSSGCQTYVFYPKAMAQDVDHRNLKGNTKPHGTSSTSCL